ncbi:hypothetical protein K432DRAFT_426309 [Lepidopterella palustris CBS 459.81]|uniref:FAD/NAD(P)-binding domain-containing protein n=1 Tax=Lepidopterella palustris CBS 459.81 TaxID=1314670 RepID=A0A8E2JEL7_9PEZI|nr:hypothetical protein K432DRAFT_426309 [Lepidopterella palustris CBS 459.81]
MAKSLPQCVDTVVIGNGPSSLILSYILHGHIPYYAGPHHDNILDTKLSKRPNLLDLTPDMYSHFQSSLRYSNQALPINTLLDTLIRPNADTEINPTSCVKWKYEPDKAVSHVVIGNSPHAGGQWADSPDSVSWDIGTLSYAEMLSLPGYSYSDHYLETRKQPMPDFVRPSRTEVAEYFQAYPAAAGVLDSVYTSIQVDHVSRTLDGFFIGSHSLRCKHLVLASGIFTVNIPPPRLLTPLAEAKSTQYPLLVIGSGFSAADIIISTSSSRKIIHIFQWNPEERPSPLRGCHHTAYPEYATIYRQMKLAAMVSGKRAPCRSPLTRKKSNPYFNRRDWATNYEGLPNAKVLDVMTVGDETIVKLQLESGEIIERSVGGLEYVIGRRGSLDYLDTDLRSEVLGADTEDVAKDDESFSNLISGRTLRAKAEIDLEVAPNVFIIGSLTGDSLVRHAVGGCVYAASKIMNSRACSMTSSISDGVKTPVGPSSLSSSASSPVIRANGTAHEDLHLDRRKLMRGLDIVSAENQIWMNSGWWGGGWRIS